MGWEPPLPQKLLVSASRVAEELNIPAWKAHELCWSLERVFYAPEGKHFRVTRRSLDAFEDLLDLGLGFRQAREALWHYRRRDGLPPADLTLERAKHLAWLERQRW